MLLMDNNFAVILSYLGAIAAAVVVGLSCLLTYSRVNVDVKSVRIALVDF